MDHTFFRFLAELWRDAKNILQNTNLLLQKMSPLTKRLAQAIGLLQSEKAGVLAELAATKDALAAALANDAADADAIATAQADAAAALAAAEAATAKVVELQALADADALEDAELSALADSVLIPEPDPTA